MTIRKCSLVALLFAAFLLCAPNVVSAKDEWLQVRSKNFLLIGNAPEKDIRKVATKLEQFRETFRLLFRSIKVSASVPTNVVVFKSDSSYRPFKPKRGDGKIDNFVAGYFQPGPDVNYITLSTEGTDADMFGIVFHEYVHYIIDTNFGRSEVPSWFNEGLAEYYQTFEIEEDQKVKLGIAQWNHLRLLSQSKLIPFQDFLGVGSRSLGGNGGHSRSIFYAQAWAMVHFLIFTGRADGMDKFVTLTLANKPPEQAFQEAFGTDYATMEKELRKYISQRLFKYQVLTLKQKLTFDSDIQVAPLAEPEANAYLGDLLYHVNRADDAEPFLRSALAVQPNLSLANTALGMVKLRQRKSDEAKTFLEKAIAQNPKNHIAYYYYAELLSRDGRDEFGFVSKMEPATSARIREMLKKSIELNPAFTESYALLAFVSLVNNDELDDAVVQLQKALKYQPGNMRYVMRIAEIYLRQEKFKEAAAIATRLAKNADSDELRERAEQMVSVIGQREQIRAQNDANRKKYEEGDGNGQGLMRRTSGEANQTPEQLAKANEAERMRALNQSLRKQEAGETRIVGQITKIVCKPSNITYSIKTENETLLLSSKDFQSLAITTFVDDGGEVGCTSDLSGSNVVASYRATPAAKAGASRGQLIALEFVPATFRFINIDAEPTPPTPTYVAEETSTTEVPADSEDQRRTMMIKTINDNLRKPAAGEKRFLGQIERTECTSKAIFYHLRSGDQAFQLSVSSPELLFIRGFTPEIRDLQLGCGMKAIELPAIFIYRQSTEAKGKVAGELLSLEFVPKSFRLDQ